MRSFARLATATALVTLGAGALQAQASSGIPVRKDAPTPTTTSTTTTSTTTTMPGDVTWTGPLGYTLQGGGSPIYCHEGDATEIAKINVTGMDMYTSGMISAEQAKALALCAIPGQISSAKMEMSGDRHLYRVDVLPTDKKTAARVDIDAYTGEVVNAKQYGGLRGLAGFLRESAERQKNKKQ